MIAVDTSIVVAAFASWHEQHEPAARALDRQPRLPSHVLLESFSVLTRLPSPHRAAPDIVEAFLSERFPAQLLILPVGEIRALLGKAAASAIIGGAIYDALIAATAKHAGATLLTRDRRALSVYEKIGVRYEMID